MACKEFCFRRLLADKQKLSKGKEINYYKFETQNYLKSGHGLSVQTMRKIYHTRCRETFLKCNFPSSFSDKNCVSLCNLGQDSEMHIYSCKYFSTENEILFQTIPFEEIFGNNVQSQIIIVNILYTRLGIRKTFLPSASPAGAPHDPREGRARAQPRLGIREAKRKYIKLKHKNKTRGIQR